MKSAGLGAKLRSCLQPFQGHWAAEVLSGSLSTGLASSISFGLDVSELASITPWSLQGQAKGGGEMPSERGKEGRF